MSYKAKTESDTAKLKKYLVDSALSLASIFTHRLKSGRQCLFPCDRAIACRDSYLLKLACARHLQFRHSRGDPGLKLARCRVGGPVIDISNGCKTPVTFDYRNILLPEFYLDVLSTFVFMQ